MFFISKYHNITSLGNNNYGDNNYGDNMGKYYNIILKITKYILIIILILTLGVISTFTIYSRSLDFTLPSHRTIEVYDRDNNHFFTISNGNKQSYVCLEDINPNLINAFISIEDKRFYNHKGVDFIRIGGAILSNLEAKYFKEGASTITQQYVRALYLTQDKEIERKIKEMMISINIETKYSKDEILEGYLNSIYFGHGVYGVNDASLFYFNKETNDLTIAECAVIAAIPKGPSFYSPILNYEKNSERKKLILKEMFNDGVISESEYTKAINDEIVISLKNNSINKTALYFQDIIVSEVSNMDILKTNKENLKVHTTIDLNLNANIEKAINKYVPDDDIEIAVFALDPKTKEVLSCVGGKNYSNSPFNRATKAKRQPGSTIKPFLYYSALENGFTPITTIYSGPTTFNIDGELYSPQNFGNIYPNRDVTMTYALATSDNIYALKTHLFLGTNVLYNTLSKLNFSTQINDNVSLCLGTSEVYLSDLVNAYSTLASLGENGQNKYITKITDYNDNIIFENNAKSKQVLNHNISYILSEAMTNVFDNNLAINISVTGSAISNMVKHKYAAKSGSTDYDNWIVGYNSDIVLGVWCGYDDNKYVDNAKTKFIKYIWADIIESYMDGKGSGWYKTPSEVVGISLNPTSGKIANVDEYQKVIYFDINNIPWYIF